MQRAIRLFSSAASTGCKDISVCPTPAIELFRRVGSETKKISTDDLFAPGTGKVAVFGVPGAFTPVCSLKHVPSYVQKAEELKAKGISKIVCVTVNDPFVAAAWSENMNVGDKVQVLADPAGNFVKSIGMDVDLSVAGLGLRSKRFSMIVENGEVKQLNVEQTPGEMNVSDAESMLKKL